MTEDELAEAREELENLRDEVREHLAGDLGGEAEDYRADEGNIPDPDADE